MYAQCVFLATALATVSAAYLRAPASVQPAVQGRCWQPRSCAADVTLLNSLGRVSKLKGET
eukprot:6210979-Pleurochrysis_carterae.AAC.1